MCIVLTSKSFKLGGTFIIRHLSSINLYRYRYFTDTVTADQTHRNMTSISPKAALPGVQKVVLGVPAVLDKLFFIGQIKIQG